jgi:hypothetical protein
MKAAGKAVGPLGTGTDVLLASGGDPGPPRCGFERKVVRQLGTFASSSATRAVRRARERLHIVLRKQGGALADAPSYPVN